MSNEAARRQRVLSDGRERPGWFRTRLEALATPGVVLGLCAILWGCAIVVVWWLV